MPPATETGTALDAVLAQAWEESWPRVIGRLARETRDLDLAEDATQDAFVVAMESWPRAGIPANPGAWLLTVARRKVLDRQRRATTLQRKLPLLIVPEGDDDPDPANAWHDDGLRLIFTCCHPALAPENRVALALRLICGLDTATIARLFLIPETTMAARLTRARKKIAAAGIAWRVPDPGEMPDRLTAVLDTVYLLFTAGHTRPIGEDLLDPILLERSEGLARLVADLLPEQPEVLGLFALIQLSNARRSARQDAAGRLIPLEDQDRSCWDRRAQAAGTAVLERALTLARGSRPGRFALQAAIEAVHLEAPTFAETDWPQLFALYTLLDAVAPSPLVKLNRAVVLGQLAGPAAGLAALDRFTPESGPDLTGPLAIARADLLRRAEDWQGAAEAYRAAVAGVDNLAQRTFLAARLAEVERELMPGG
jgi:RNA polymerase sigma-70 factor (ECF subfamily)